MLSFFPLDVFDEIWDLIQSVSEGFLTYSFNLVSLNAVLMTAHVECYFYATSSNFTP